MKRYKIKLIFLLISLIISLCLCGCAGIPTAKDADTNKTNIINTTDTVESVSLNAVNFTGSWNRTNTIKGCKATIEIKNQTNDTFDFYFNGIFGANSGQMDEKATIKSEQKAVFSVLDRLDESVLATITFEIKDSVLNVSVSDGDYTALGFGANVTIAGEYTREEPVYINQNIVDEVLKTKENKNNLSKLLGDNAYNQMIKVMEEGISYETDELTYSGFINGAGTGFDLLIENDKIYCLGLGLEGEGYTLYTNDIAYKDKLPDFLKTYNDCELKFIYKDIK